MASGTNVAQFNRAVLRQSERLGPKRAALFQQKVALDALAGLVEKTRVDTGRARGNWQVSEGRRVTTEVETTDKAGAPTIAAGEQEIAKLDGFSIAYVQNNVPYIQPLEDLDHMLALTLSELTAVLGSGA